MARTLAGLCALLSMLSACSSSSSPATTPAGDDSGSTDETGAADSSTDTMASDGVADADTAPACGTLHGTLDGDAYAMTIDELDTHYGSLGKDGYFHVAPSFARLPSTGPHAASFACIGHASVTATSVSFSHVSFLGTCESAPAAAGKITFCNGGGCGGEAVKSTVASATFDAPTIASFRSGGPGDGTTSWGMSDLEDLGSGGFLSAQDGGSGVFVVPSTLADAGAIYCATSVSISGSGFGVTVTLDGLHRLGTCPGKTESTGTLDACLMP